MSKIQSLRAEQSRAEQSRAEQSRAELVFLGSLFGEDRGTGYAGGVWDANGLGPTLTNMQGGGRQPHVVEVKKMDANELGFIEHGTGKHQSNTVFGTDGISPAITTIEGGGTQQIKICDVKQLAHLENGTGQIITVGNIGDGKTQSRTVYMAEGIYPTLCSGMDHGNTIPYIVEIGGHQKVEKESFSLRTVRTEEGKAIKKAYETGEAHHGFNEYREADPREDGVSNTITTVKKNNMVLEQCIVAMRGRNPENPSDRAAGIELEQRLEPQEDGICNTLTSVQKDNLVLEKRYIAYDEQNRCTRDETFGTLTTDGSSPKHNNRVIEAELIAYDDYNSTIPEDQSVSPTLTTNCGASALRNGVKMIKVRQATKEGFALCELGGVVDLDYPSSETRRGRVIENGQISPTLTTENIPSVIELGNPEFYNFLYEIDGEIYLIRIRKLMPLECWRLMGFTDEDFHKAEQVVSNTQLYKQAGNSIVVNCLEGIFRRLIE